VLVANLGIELGEARNSLSRAPIDAHGDRPRRRQHDSGPQVGNALDRFAEMFDCPWLDEGSAELRDRNVGRPLGHRGAADAASTSTTARSPAGSDAM